MDRCRALVVVIVSLSVLGCTEGAPMETGRPNLPDRVDGGRSFPPPALDASGSAAPASCVHSGPPVLEPTDLPTCPMCSGGRCLPLSLVPEENRGRLADCDAEHKCVPDLFIRTGGNFLLATCESVGGAEGRCASICLPEIAERMSSLPQATCAADERCAPCFHPATGEDTGLCSLACDTGPSTSAPPPTTPCCGGAGSCLPEAAIPPEDRGDLGADTCTGAGMLCAPTAFTDPSFRPATCRSIGGGEGRCMPECLPSVQEDLDRLPEAGCGGGERCVPCYDPTDGSETGACGLNGDAPAEPAFTFPSCCEEDGVSRGTCVPSSSVPADRREDLDEEECPEDMGFLCVPNVNIEDPDHRNTPCRTEGGGFLGGSPEPGACVLSCILGFRAVFLSRSTCAAWEKCAPCIDPLSGGPSGACD